MSYVHGPGLVICIIVQLLNVCFCYDVQQPGWHTETTTQEAQEAEASVKRELQQKNRIKLFLTTLNNGNGADRNMVPIGKVKKILSEGPDTKGEGGSKLLLVFTKLDVLAGTAEVWWPFFVHHMF